MTLPTTDTVVTYPAGDTSAEARVLHVEPLGDGRAAVLLDRTACHPVDAGWPDQGPDRAVLRVGEAEGAAVEVLDCVVAATDGAVLHLGADIPVRKGTEGWAFVVAHLVDTATAPAEGDAVTVEADAAHRAALSAGHSACHLAALALNLALADAWSKEPRRDSLGSPDFDGAANETSTITEFGAVDTYRIGKSARKAGFDPTALDDPDAVAASANATLAAWVAAASPVRIECEGESLTDRRYWVAELPEGEARIPCGGTHVTSTAELGRVTVTLETQPAEGALTLVMTTRLQ
ncbi:MAG: metal-dependent hydrolase [Microbacteriaceae bacterium]|nr:metal-dependent hydrolase [Microbacteriaceae bacterium]